MSTIRLGIDAAKATLQLHLITPDRSASRQVANTPAGFARLWQWLGQQGVEATTLTVGLEATGRYEEAIATELFAHGCTVYVINPYRVKRWAQSELIRTKTDKVDARVLAEFVGCAKKLHAWKPVAPAYRTLQALVRQREEFKDTQTAWQNRHEAPGQLPVIQQSCARMLEAIASELATLDAAITDLVASEAEVKADIDLGQTIIGIGHETVTLLVGELGRCTQFTESGQVAAQVGLSVVHRQSGTSVHARPRLSKQGNALVRKALFMPALTAMRWDPTLRAFAQRLEANGKAKMQIVAAVMRKLIERYYAIMRSRCPYDPLYQWEATR